MSFSDAMASRSPAFFDGVSVPFDPALSPRLAFGSRSASALLSPFNDERVTLTFNATSAIAHAARVLGLQAPDSVLCPAYNCGHEIEPLLHQGLTVNLYAVTDDLRVDVEDLRRQIDKNTRAVLITHYFGFPQSIAEIRALCDEHQLWLIEDCAHGLFSQPGGRPLGTTGDVAVFSLRKTVAIPNGGALVLNNERLRADLELVSPPVTTTWNKMLDRWLDALRTQRSRGSKSASASLAGLLPVAVARKVLRALPGWGEQAWYDTDSPDFKTVPEVAGWGMAGVSQRILSGVDPEVVRSRRRHNFQWLVDALGSDVVVPVYGELADGICPLACPVFSDDAADLVRQLRARGIGVWNWWDLAHPALDWAAHPREFDLKQRIVALPIHQDLDEGQLRTLAESVRSTG